jgi:hypothetical protein
VCTYCDAIKDGLGSILPGEGISHGICHTCFVEKFGHMFTETEIEKMYNGGTDEEEGI